MNEKIQLLESDHAVILTHLREHYEATCEICGADGEEAAEAKVLYKKAFSKPLAECQDEVIEFYKELYDAVAAHGGTGECYQSDPGLTGMIKKAVDKGGANMNIIKAVDNYGYYHSCTGKGRKEWKAWRMQAAAEWKLDPERCIRKEADNTGKAYFEMNGAEKVLNHISHDLDWAVCMMAEGFLYGPENIRMDRGEFTAAYKGAEEHLEKAHECICGLLGAVREREEG